jgi:hypothetical protein
VSARDVAGLVSQNADQLVRRLAFDNSPEIDEDAAAVRHESVEREVADQRDFHRGRIDIGGAQKRGRVIAHQLFDFSVANGREAILALGISRRGKAGRAHGERRCQRDGAEQSGLALHDRDRHSAAMHDKSGAKGARRT